LQVFVGSESDVSVWYDDLRITWEQALIVQENHYYPFGMNLVGIEKQGQPHDRFQYNGKEKQEEFGLNAYDYGARLYSFDAPRWWQIDPKAEEMRRWSPYNYVFNNPLRYTDPDGMTPDDWVKRKDGSIYWDNEATSQATTKTGETYLGQNLTFTFNSYINNSFDGPEPPWEVVGDKLTSTITINSTKNADGSLKSVDVMSDYHVHETGGIPLLKGRDYFPRLGKNQNKEIKEIGVRSFSATFEQHASVPGFEAAGLNILGYDVVNVAQQMKLSLSGNELSISAATDVFPSATLSVKGSGNSNTYKLMQYDQPSFKETHGRDKSFIDNGRGGVDVISTPRRPAPSFHLRYKK
jgi:RHS repeat-associated protein